MSKSHSPQADPHHGGEIGIVVLSIVLFAACGAAWLGGTQEAATPLRLNAADSTAISQTDVEPAKQTQATGSDGSATAAITVSEEDDFALIVRFRSEPDLDELAKAFRKDPDRARARFLEWAADKPALDGLTLERASYSGELVLTGPGSMSASDTIAAIEQMDNVAYVDRDYSAKASRGN